jgi:spore coat protein A, manganese oxidase
MRHSNIFSAVLVVVTLLIVGTATSFAQLPGGSLDPLTIPKYQAPLTVPPPMPKTANATLDPAIIDYYEIGVRQFEQQVLPTGFSPTKVWSYGPANASAANENFNYPAFTIEATVNKPTRVKWVNQLVADPVACVADKTSAACNFLPHLLPVDRTLHWANPEKLMCMGTMANQTDCRPDPDNGTLLLSPYDGPVPMVTHVHGAHVNPESDGYPEAWWLPAANNIANYATRGSHFGQITGAPDEAGAALFEYRNDQRATTLWYHDHSLGMTRTNVYAGPAGFYMLRGGPDDLPSGVAGGLPGGPYEIPIAIQDRSFNTDGSLFYPTSRSFFDGFLGPYIGTDFVNTPSDLSPLHNPEFFGNTMVVNGKTWPFLNVEQRKYRFRFLNGCDSRFLILKFSDGKTTFTQIGSEGGFLPKPVVLDQILLALAERADVIVDFSKMPVGTTVQLLNVGPDEPFGGNFPVSRQADPNTTGQVMEFHVVAAATDNSAIPVLPKLIPLKGRPNNVRQVSLNELDSSLICWDGTGFGVPAPCPKGFFPAGPISARLGTVDPLTGLGIPLLWEEATTEKPKVGDVEVWEISNFTEDAHPIHIHMVMFQVVNRQPMGGGKARPPEAWETGFKDTVIAYPGEITRVKAFFDIPGLFVWHCHILSHEDNEMMRPYEVIP